MNPGAERARSRRVKRGAVKREPLRPVDIDLMSIVALAEDTGRLRYLAVQAPKGLESKRRWRIYYVEREKLDALLRNFGTLYLGGTYIAETTAGRRRRMHRAASGHGEVPENQEVQGQAQSD